MFKPLAEACEILDTDISTLRRLIRLDLVGHKELNGVTVIHVPEAAVALDVDVAPSLETANLALIQRRIKRLDIQTQRDRLAYQEKLGHVIPKSEVEQGQLERVRAVRTMLLGLSRTLPLKLVGKDVREITVILDDESRRILRQFAGEDR